MQIEAVSCSTWQPGIADEVVNTEGSIALNLIKGLFI